MKNLILALVFISAVDDMAVRVWSLELEGSTPEETCWAFGTEGVVCTEQTEELDNKEGINDKALRT